ncbi:MAG: glycosyltransferase [Cyanobacteria bacterium K_Offshore_surface_m2_239]|nr:glycosyltransferase [Cyanobacteria bacterium K_Offshore_surface_m2_239]
MTSSAPSYRLSDVMMTESSPFSFSLIVPLYRSEETIDKLVTRLEGLDFHSAWQAIFIDDGSPDQSYNVLCRRLNKSPLNAVVIRHTRNFGEHQAVLTGYRHAEGEYFINIDDDLQNPPEEAIRLLDYAKDNDLDVTYGNHICKKHNIFRNLGSVFAKLTARWLLDLPNSYYLSSFRCVKRLVAEKITCINGPYVYLDGLLSQVTTRIGSLDVRHDPRDAGSSGYNLRRLVRLWLVILTSFSLMPLRFASLIGIGASLIGAVSLAYILISSLFGRLDVAGWASVISSILFFGGIQCLLLGMVGEYIGRIYLTVSGKPQAHIRNLAWYGKMKSPVKAQSLHVMSTI